jgi:sulfate adenylyltransferase
MAMTTLPELLEKTATLPSVQLSPPAVGELTLLAQGAFFPVTRYLNRREYDMVNREMLLPNGAFFPYPLAVASDVPVEPGTEVTLRDGQNVRLAILSVEDCWQSGDDYRLGGSVRILQFSPRRDFIAQRLGPAELPKDNYAAIVVSELLTVEQENAAVRIASAGGYSLLIQVLEQGRGRRQLDHFLRMHAHQLIARRLPASVKPRVNLLPFADPAEPLRAVLTHALIQRNFGASLLLADCSALPRGELEGRMKFLSIRLEEIPPAAGGSYHPEIQDLLADAIPPAHRQGFCVWFTGLPSSGKSTIAEALHILIREHGRRCTLLDGDIVRTHLSKGLGFSRADRDTNILRIAFVAGEIVRHNGAVITAAVSPYEATRQQARRMIGDEHFILVHVATPADVCEQRDVKGYYAQARSGAIRGFTGVDDPYEVPAAPDLVLETIATTPEDNARRVAEYLAARGFLLPA